MKYCVRIGTANEIESSNHLSDETLIKNAINAGFAVEQVEILTQAEFDERKALEPEPIKEPSEKERIEQLERENALLKAQKQALSEQVDFHEELIVELATQIYA